MKKVVYFILISMFCLMLSACNKENAETEQESGTAIEIETGSETESAEEDVQEDVQEDAQEDVQENVQEDIQEEVEETAMQHTADHELDGQYYLANYSECMGGYEEDYYWCTVCEAAVDEEGNLMESKPGTGQHTRSEEAFAGCMLYYVGEETVEPYNCTVCGALLYEDGSILICDQIVEHHTPDLETLFPADYTEENGGYKEDYYKCIHCDMACREDGTGVIWEN